MQLTYLRTLVEVTSRRWWTATKLKTTRAADGLRFLRCRLAGLHPAFDDHDHCVRCDAVRTPFWGGWVVLDG